MSAERAVQKGAELPRTETRPVVTTEQLLGRSREITIRHEGQDYRLQVTRNGKLILKK